MSSTGDASFRSWCAQLEHVRDDIGNMLELVTEGCERCALVLDPALSPVVSRVAPHARWLADHFNVIRVLSLDPDLTHIETEATAEAGQLDLVLYMVRAEPVILRQLVFTAARLPPRVQIRAVIAPHGPDARVVREIERAGLSGRIQLTALNLPVLPLDKDVALLNPPTDLRTRLDGAIQDAEIVNALHELQFVYGRFGKISGKGKRSMQIKDAIVKRAQIPGADFHGRSHIGQVVILDRELDMITPMLTQITYEGLLDEVMSIRAGYVRLPKSMLADSGDQPSTQYTSTVQFKNWPLNDDDPLYRGIRDMGCGAVLETMQDLVANVKEKLDERHGASNVHELRTFVKSLPDYLQQKQSLQTHCRIARLLADFSERPVFTKTLRCEGNILEELSNSDCLEVIEDMVAGCEEYTSVLRLCCLWSIVNDGIKTSTYEMLCREILHSYGYSKLPLLIRLRTTGLFFPRDGTPNSTIKHVSWKKMVKNFDLISDIVDASKPKDIHHVYSFSGYAPLLVRIAQPSLEMRQQPFAVADRLLSDTPSFSHGSASHDGATLIVIVGGITFAEIAALRFLQKNKMEGRPLLIASDAIISGKALIKAHEPQPAAV